MDYINEASNKISRDVKAIKYTDDKQVFKVSSQVTIDWENVLGDFPENNSNTTIKELQYLSGLTKSRTPRDVELIKQVDEEPNLLYIDVLKRLGLKFPVDEFNKAWDIIYPVIMNLKYYFNRPRPYQLADYYNIDISYIATDSINTPSYPSGHSAYAATSAYLLAAKYPEHSGEFFDKVGIVSKCRMMQGVHYPSDTEASMVITGAIWENIRYKLFPEYKQF
jgi:acid phosphatase (class A)